MSKEKDAKPEEPAPIALTRNFWKYPKFDGPPPLGKRLLILTAGGMPVISEWTRTVKDGFFVAYFEFPERDPSKEIPDDPYA